MINIDDYNEKLSNLDKQIANLKKERCELIRKTYGVEYDDVDKFIFECFTHYDEDESLHTVVSLFYGVNVERGLIIEIDGVLIGFVNEIRTSDNGFIKFFVNDEGHLYNNGMIVKKDNISSIKVCLDKQTYDYFRKF